MHNNRFPLAPDKWMDDLRSYVFLTVPQSYEDDDDKGCVQRKPLTIENIPAPRGPALNQLSYRGSVTMRIISVSVKLEKLQDKQCLMIAFLKKRREAFFISNFRGL